MKAEKETKAAPVLPPKETRVPEVTTVETTRSPKKKAGVTSTRIVGTNVKPMKSVETQTDEVISTSSTLRASLTKRASTTQTQSTRLSPTGPSHRSSGAAASSIAHRAT